MGRTATSRPICAATRSTSACEGASVDSSVANTPIRRPALTAASAIGSSTCTTGTPTTWRSSEAVSEIEEQLSLAAGAQVTIQFTPHLIPVNRGILTTLYLTPVVYTYLAGIMERWNRRKRGKRPRVAVPELVGVKP